MSTTEIRYADWPALALANERVSLIILPDIGGKIVSLRLKPSSPEFLWQDATRPYRRPVYGDDFGNYDASGFDECFPTIASCVYPDEPWRNVDVPDHGELWCMPWRYELADERTIYLHAYGVRFPYHFERWITLHDDACITFRYRLTNLSPFPLKSIWSAHPLFAAQEGMRLLLPGSPQMRLAHIIGNRLRGQVMQEYVWPWLVGPDGEPVDYSRIESPAVCANEKVYIDAPPAGWCALFRPESHDYIAWRFCPQKTPFLGVCINHGGWPPSGAAGFWVALEPCSGWPDRLDHATTGGTCQQIDGWASEEWSLCLHLGEATNTDEIEQRMERPESLC